MGYNIASHQLLPICPLKDGLSSRTQPNARLHLLAGIAVVVACVFTEVDLRGWAFIALCIAIGLDVRGIQHRHRNACKSSDHRARPANQDLSKTWPQRRLSLPATGALIVDCLYYFLDCQLTLFDHSII